MLGNKKDFKRCFLFIMKAEKEQGTKELAVPVSFPEGDYY